MMNENKKLTSTNKKLEELSFKKVTKMGSSPNVNDEEDKTEALIRQTAILKKEKKDLQRQLEESNKELSLLKETTRNETQRMKQQNESLQKDLEDYKLMLGKTKA